MQQRGEWVACAFKRQVVGAGVFWKGEPYKGAV